MQFFQVKAMYQHQVMADEMCYINDLADALYLD